MSKNAITKSLPLWESNGLPSQYNGQMQDNRTSQSLDARNIASSLAESMKRASALRRHLPEWAFEFVGRFEEHGWKLAGTIVPIAYTAWSVWLLAAGVVLLTWRFVPNVPGAGLWDGLNALNILVMSSQGATSHPSRHAATKLGPRLV